MNDIHTLPDRKDWGLEFNYAAWNAETQVILSQVPWNSDYLYYCHFNNDAAKLNYLISKPHVTLDGLTYHGYGTPIKVNMPFVEAQKYNYLRAWNPAQPIPGDSINAFYYFILDVVRVNASTTLLYIQPDVMQSFVGDMEFGTCFIEQGHYGMAHPRSNDNYGRDMLSINEGLDVGGEYAIVRQYKEEIAAARTGQSTPNISNYSIMIVTTVSLTNNPGDTKEPNLVSATGSNMGNLPNGAEIYVFDTKLHFEQFMLGYSKSPWITQGIISITAIPKLTRYGISYQNITLPTKDMGAEFDVTVGKVLQGNNDTRKTALAPNWRENVQLALGKYRKLDKLMTYPFTVLELTTYAGQPIIIKPESWNDKDGTVIELAHLAPPAQRISIYPYRYNATINSPVDQNENGVINDGGEFLDMATGISNFPTFSLVNNGYMGYLASNANSIAFQHSSADWGQSKALEGANVSANNTNLGISAGIDQTNIGLNAQYAQNNLTNDFATSRAAINAGTTIGSGAMLGPGGLAAGVGSAAMSGLGTAMEIAQRNAATGISAGATVASANRANQLTGDLRDSNKAYAQYAANGDYSNTIAGINARTNDAKLSQPTTSGQMGGDAFLLANYKWGYDLKVKQISGAALTSVGDYMLRYGYRVNRFGKMPANFQCMTRFTFWKVKELPIISAACPEPVKQAIRGIFEKGVTVYNNPDDIGRIALENNDVIIGAIVE